MAEELSAIVASSAEVVERPHLAQAWLQLFLEELLETPAHVADTPFEHLLARVRVPLRALELIRAGCVSAVKAATASVSVSEPAGADAVVVGLVAEELRVKFSLSVAGGEAASLPPFERQLLDVDAGAVSPVKRHFAHNLALASKTHPVLSVAWLGATEVMELVLQTLLVAGGQAFGFKVEQSRGLKVIGVLFFLVLV